MAAKVITITNGKFKVATTATGTGTVVDCQIVDATITVNPKLSTIPATWCQGEGQAAGKSGFQLDLTILQDWGVTPAGLCAFSMANDGLVVFWELTVDGETTPTPKIQWHGSAYCACFAIGGPSGEALQAQATWPIIGVPITGPSTITLMAESADAEAVA